MVKIGLVVLLGGFTLIAGGMFLSRPDRSIPPFSIGSQESTVVAVHVPSWTSDPEIEALIRRFRTIGETNRDFRSMKVRPTTPDDPTSLYGEVVLYIFSDPGWTEPATLHRYLAADVPVEVGGQGDEKDETFRRQFERSARGGFIYHQGRARGWLGPVPHTGTPERSQNIQILFDDGT